MMHFYNRGLLYIKRNFGKSMLLFSLVFLLITSIAGAMMASIAIVHTEHRLWQQIPPLATIIHDQEAIAVAQANDSNDFSMEMLSSALIESISTLPYVRAVDYAVFSHNFFSYDLNRANDMAIYLEAGFLEEDLEFLFRDFLQDERGLEQFTLKGVRHPEIADVIGGAITLVAGRAFTDIEIRNATPVAIIPYEFAVKHQLTIGESFELTASVYGSMFGIPAPPSQFQPDDLLLTEAILFEVVGIFEPNVVIEQFDWLSATNYRDLNNRIYVPIDVAKIPDQLFAQYLLQASEERRNEFWGPDFNYEDLANLQFNYVDLVFILHDVLDIATFNLAASELLPEFWIMDDLSDALSDMMPLLMQVQQIATWIIRVTTIACLIILGLVLILFFYGRRHEIGIYLALGEKKSKVYTSAYNGSNDCCSLCPSFCFFARLPTC